MCLLSTSAKFQEVLVPEVLFVEVLFVEVKFPQFSGDKI